MMRFKCPHCQIARDYSELEYREIFMRCKNCKKYFRAAEASPLTASVTEMGNRRRGGSGQPAGRTEEYEKSKSVAKLNAEAAIYIKRGDYERARVGLQESLKMKPNQPHVERLLRKIATLR